MKEKQYFTTGEFAKICEIEKHVLFYYDQIGLLQPAFVDENNYRYYSSYQYDTFTVISLLKNLGMPLQDIKLYLEQRSPSFFLSLLEEKAEDIQKQIEHLKKTYQYVAFMRRQTEDAVYSSKETIEIVFQPKTEILCSRSPDREDLLNFDMYTKEYTQFCAGNGLTREHHSGTILKRGTDGRLDPDLFAALYTVHFTQEEADRSETSVRTTMRSGKYLNVYHQGDYSTLPDAYRKVSDFIRENGIKPGRYVYEEYILTDAAVRNPEEYVTRIFMEIDD